MRFDSSTWLLFIAAGAVTAAASVACSSAPPSDVQGSSSAATSAPFDKNAVLDDTSLKDSDAMTVAQIQSFLDKNPWGKKSVLATYEQDGQTAAEIMHAASVKHGINPIELLVRVQMEQGLINKTTASSSSIDIAFGCGCPHSPVCSDKYMGFANQAECAAGTLSRSIAAAATSTGTASGWARSRSKETQDGIMITPKNAATAALYTYTPWVGEAGGGKTGVGGASLHHAVWDRFATSVSYGAWATDTTPSTPSTPTNGTNEEDTNQVQADSGAQQVDPVDPEPTPEPDPTPDPDPTPTPTADSGTNTVADGGVKPGSDGGPTNIGDSTPPSDGREDDAVLSEGNAPPASNAPPPKPTSAGRRSPEELPEATEEELSKKPKSSAGEGGCMISGASSSNGTDGMLLALGVVAAVVGSRKRSKADVSE